MVEGYTLECLEAGTWALRKASNAPEADRQNLFEEFITTITIQGGDADTLVASFTSSHHISCLITIKFWFTETRQLQDPS